MKEELELVREFHKKFDVPILSYAQIPQESRFQFRFDIMKSEVQEYLERCEKNDLSNVAKELADILYCVYGTILEHGLQDVMQQVFEEVHNSNMSKDCSEFKMIKGQNYFKADIQQFFKN